jgi:hypothetical protein
MNQHEEDEDMFAGLLKQFFKNAAIVVAGSGAMLLASNTLAANCSITTSPDPAIINEGGSVTFTGSVSGKPPQSYSWTFDGGTPATSSNETEVVTYNSSVGSPFTATLNGVDGKGGTCSAQVSVTVNAVGGNNPPVANDDAYSTDQDTPLSVAAPGVLGNDTDADNDPITVDSYDSTSSAGGSVTMLTDGSFDYTPPSGFTGDDTFTYVATDGTDTSNAATVTITVSAVGGNNPPVANDDAYSTDQDTPLSVAAPGVLGNDTDADNDPITVDSYDSASSAGGSVAMLTDGSFDYTPPSGFTGDDTFTYVATDGTDTSNAATVTITVSAVGVGPTARGDAYATPVGKTLDVVASRVSGVLYNDFGGTAPLTAELVSGPANGTLQLNSDGSFDYTPNATLTDNDNDSFVYRAVDSGGNPSADTTVNINILSDQPDFKIMMNYELGMHCTGFEFAYCCVLPPYNSILAQVVKPQSTANTDSGDDFPRLLEGSHEMGLDGLGRPTVVRAGELDANGNYKTYMLEYFHDAQPRNEGQGKPQLDTLISAVEGNSLFYTSTIYDSASLDANGALVTGSYEGVDDVVLGDGDFNDPTDNYANGWLNHFYIYQDLEGSNPNNSSLEADKVRLGVTGHIEYPADVGAALQPMGPTGSAAGFDNVLTFSGDTGTVVYTQMKVLENLPVMLTSPDIWEALGLPLTPFEDSVDFFGDPGAVDEDSIRPYVAMKARLHEAICDQDPTSGTYGDCSQGPAVIASNGQPVIGHGTAPIDIPNCERCHSVPATDGQGNPNMNSPSYIRSDFLFPHAGDGTTVNSGDSLESITDVEYQFWNAYYGIVPGIDSDWYSRLKGAAINMLALHDFDQGTGFTANWPNGPITLPAEKAAFAQNTRLGKESVICQKCHADNVIATVKSATKNGATIKPITEAIHWRHREISEGGSIDFADAAGRSGGCQGCHPAHRSDGVMDGYPITLGGDNSEADGDNRLAAGGCFVGRDVHSNAMKDVDGAETPEHLNAVGQWLSTNVFNNQDGAAGVPGHDTRGLWCTNCHTQLGQQIWAAEDCNDLIHGDCLNDVRGLGSLAQIASAIGTTEAQVISWLDPNNQDLHGTGLGDDTHAIWDPAISDALLATIEVSTIGPDACAPLTGVFNATFGVDVCVSLDDDGDPSVNILSFCTTDDCVSRINGNPGDQSQWRYAANPFQGTGTVGAAVPFSAATDGRDHWLSPGEPHCADCHAAPYVEQSGNINAFPPFNYPAKASLMRYSRGHQDISCQGCHESIHGLYPVTPTIDSTSYAQAAALNHDGSHGPLKCGACHEVDSAGVPTWMKGVEYNGSRIRTFDDAVSWAHTFTREASVLTDGGACTNCHSYPKGKNAVIEEANGGWLDHSFVGRVGRAVQSQAEIEALGHVAGDPDTDGDGINDRTAQDIADSVCTACHSEKGGPSGAFLSLVTCDNTTWKSHVFDGRLDPKVWEFVTHEQTSSSCGW